jgi:hypothetical protein
MNYAHLCIFAHKNRIVMRRTQCGRKSVIASSIVEESRRAAAVSAQHLVSL